MRRPVKALVRGIATTIGGLLIVNALCAYLLLGRVREQIEEEDPS